MLDLARPIYMLWISSASFYSLVPRYKDTCIGSRGLVHIVIPLEYYIRLGRG